MGIIVCILLDSWILDLRLFHSYGDVTTKKTWKFGLFSALSVLKQGGGGEVFFVYHFFVTLSIGFFVPSERTAYTDRSPLLRQKIGTESHSYHQHRSIGSPCKSLIRRKYKILKTLKCCLVGYETVISPPCISSRG